MKTKHHLFKMLYVQDIKILKFTGEKFDKHQQRTQVLFWLPINQTWNNL